MEWVQREEEKIELHWDYTFQSLEQCRISKMVLQKILSIFVLFSVRISNVVEWVQVQGCSWTWTLLVNNW